MPTEDEESNPLEETSSGDEPVSGEAGEETAPESFDTSTVSDEPPTISEEVSQGLLRARAALEEKNWQAIADYCGVETISVEGHPEPVSAIVEKLNAITTNLCDFEGVILQVGKQEVDADRARFTLRFRIMWNSCDDWEDHDLFVDAHLGYQRIDDAWKVSYLSVNRAYPQREQEAAKPSPKPAPEEPPNPSVTPSVSPQPPVAVARRRKAKRARGPKAFARMAPPPPPKPQPPKLEPPPVRADQPMTDEYFSQAAAQYFSQFAAPEGAEAVQKRLQTVGSSVGGKHHLLYLPVIMHEDLIKKILGND